MLITENYHTVIRSYYQNGHTYNFSDYKTFKELFRDIYYETMKINLIKSGLRDFKEEIENMNKGGKKMEDRMK